MWRPKFWQPYLTEENNKRWYRDEHSLSVRTELQNLEPDEQIVPGVNSAGTAEITRTYNVKIHITTTRNTRVYLKQMR